VELKQALERIAGRPDLWIWRPTGMILRLTNRLAMLEYSNGKPKQPSIKLADILTDDWLVGDFEALQKYAEANPLRYYRSHEGKEQVGVKAPEIHAPK
jgi:hypothetical protein